MFCRTAASSYTRALALSLARRGGGAGGSGESVLAPICGVRGPPATKEVDNGSPIVPALEGENLMANVEGKKRFEIVAPGKPYGHTNLLSFLQCRRYYSLDSLPVEGQIPAELLSSKSGLRPDRKIGQYEDLLARVTNFQNEDKGYMVLAGDVFDVPIRTDIIHKVVKWQLAKRRQGTHSTKTISEVSGTGRKPYKQKGTGRARHGTLRGPQFRGGATMHGPKPRSHAIKCQKKVRRLGLKIALSARTAEGKLLVFDNLDLLSHKTKDLLECISHLEGANPLSRKEKKTKILLVDGSVEDKLKLACRNLHYVNVLPTIGLNVYSILQHETLVMTQDAVNRIVERMHTPINR